jgi:hypothetical protein
MTRSVTGAIRQTVRKFPLLFNVKGIVLIRLRVVPYAQVSKEFGIPLHALQVNFSDIFLTYFSKLQQRQEVCLRLMASITKPHVKTSEAHNASELYFIMVSKKSFYGNSYSLREFEQFTGSDEHSSRKYRSISRAPRCFPRM